MKELLKPNIKLIIGLVLGLIIAGGISIYALTISANDISYDNNISGLEANNVKDAIDELYSKSNESNYADMKLVGTYQLDTTHVISYTKTFDLSQETNYQNLEASDFYVVIESIALAAGSGGSSTNWFNIEKTYDSTTGSLTITVPYICYANYGVWLKGSVYLNK